MCYKKHYKNVTTAEAPELSLPITPYSALVRAVVIHSPTASVTDVVGELYYPDLVGASAANQEPCVLA